MIHFVLASMLGLLAGTFTPSLDEDLFEAARGGDVERVRALLDADLASLNATDPEGRTPLHLACEAGQLATARLLLDRGAELDATDLDRRTPLHLSVRGGNSELLRLLVDRGADVNALSRDSTHPLFSMVWPQFYRHDDALYLIEHGAAVNSSTTGYCEMLVSAASRGNGEFIDLLLEHGALYPENEGERSSLLYRAALGGVERVFLDLRKLGVSFGNTQMGEVFLRAAATGGSAEIGRNIIESGIEPDVDNPFVLAPIHLAAENGHLEFVAMLIEEGADVNLRNGVGQTAYNLAKLSGRSDIQKLIRARGGDVGRQRFPKLEGPYLGQTPPGKVVEYFAPGIVSIEGRGEVVHSSPAFSPDGTEFLWTREAGGPILHAKQVGGRWQAPQIASFASENREEEPIFSHDGNRVYFLSRRPDSVTGKVDICFVTREGGGWSEPKPASPEVNAYDHFWQFCLDEDDAIYLRSQRTDGLGSYDIYRADMVDGRHTEPVNLGAPINTPEWETMPFIARDGSYMLFVRRLESRETGRLRHDIYISYRNEDGAWEEPIDVGPPINSKSRSQICPMVSPDGKYVFFIRDGFIVWVSAEVLPPRE